MSTILRAIEYYLPEKVLTNEELACLYPDWTAARIEQKLGIVERHVAADDECASDLAVRAAERLFARGILSPADVDYLLFCTQAPDYILPTTACIIQQRLGIPQSAGALDFNLGCSGFVYGLGLAKGLIETRQAKNILLLTADTYTKFMHPDDKGVRTLFGDAATASFITAGPAGTDASTSDIGPFVYGTNGSGARNLIVEAGGARKRKSDGTVTIDDNGLPHCDANLYMNGPEIFSFTLTTVFAAVEKLLTKSQHRLEDIDLFVFHQANKHMLENLRLKCRIPKEKFYVCMRHTGNTVSSTIPIALQHALTDGTLRPGQLAMLVGFGVGYSWAATLVRLGHD